ncbi:DNA-binding response regulator [Amycolatopsis balhimycina DSM 5908]|uniref:DNA-binding response regulator n=1 Tax=Amycolatopsis balhimycina DSM 5908 TaxID=1081091 RepID=A0A428W3I6_AMYBA|nr:response regulator transcription factor [Amycolatopsis balhimycina]RSM37650.1 DNA-binding response regulator [Amycolatopsis balhimycina DSM 5908]
MIRVLIVDDQALVRAGFREIVGSAADLDVVGEAANGADAVRLAAAHRPDVVVMDIRMPELDGIEATRRITAELTGVRVLVLTTFDLDEYVFAALRAGASGFLLKDTPSAELLAAIRVVAAGDALLAPGVTRRLIAEFAAQPARPSPRADLRTAITAREQEVLALVAAGLSNAEIGLRLHITAGTAKTHVGHLMLKLAARDRVHLVILAYQAGLAAM